MELQIATLCDTASEHQGKLNVIGTFDTLIAQNFPAGFSFTLAMRFCFTAKDHGQHRFSIRLEEDGVEGGESSAKENVMTVTMPDASNGFTCKNLIHPLQGQVKKAGVYWFTVRYDGEVMARVPLRVLSHQVEKKDAEEGTVGVAEDNVAEFEQ